MQLTDQTPLRRLVVKEFVDLKSIQEWCRGYDRHNRYQQPTDTRFLIGLYQIYQGMDWNPGPNKNESYAAAFLHFMMVVERMDLCIECEIVDNLLFVEPAAIDLITCKPLLREISYSAQQVFYAGRAAVVKSARSSRYNKRGLTISMSKILTALIAAVPPDDRAQALEDASRIMTERL